MHKGLIIAKGIAIAAIVASGALAAQIYKVVDENGNVTYTDRPPPDGSGEVVLPEISIVETDYPEDVSVVDEAAEAEEQESDERKSPGELRRMYRDFRILQPEQEQTYWGTGNQVVVSWGVSIPYEPGMSVSVVVDGQSQEADPNSNLPITLERGEHQVYVVLRDARGRRIVSSDTVTFYVQQGSRLINPG